MNIPLVNLNRQYENIKEEVDAAIKKILGNSQFINGEELRTLEKNFAEFCNKKYCVGVSSGTSALFICLKCLGIKQGDEVVTSPSTFIATTEAIRLVGAKAIFVDVNESNNLIDVDKIEEKITEKTKAIIPVHLYGNVCDMKKINELAEKYNLKVIEDCAQSHGSTYSGQVVPISDVGCFSFYR